ncbi:MAG: Maf family protein [Spirosomaceae bacterium]|nr:Maf family protein [Spirosomataceae bacterium]
MLTLNRPLTLASNSPRRKQLLQELGFRFEVEVRPTDETFPDTMPVSLVPSFLATQKAIQFSSDIAHRLILCADTIVVVDQEILNKPQDTTEAYTMLRKLSGRAHEVMTGVALLSGDDCQTETDVAKVHFKTLSDAEIHHYIAHFRPFDKAGGYGIQEWIGMIGIERIEGSFYTIMGLPVHRVYALLQPYLGNPT